MIGKITKAFGLWENCQCGSRCLEDVLPDCARQGPLGEPVPFRESHPKCVGSVLYFYLLSNHERQSCREVPKHQ